jgi:hypothetical protein
MFKSEAGNWVNYRALNPLEINYHAEPGELDGLSYYERMDQTKVGVLKILKSAQQDDVSWVLFIHGSSTSRQGNTTYRSVIRGVMRSKDATPYIIRKECIQHPSVFVAAIRPK